MHHRIKYQRITTQECLLWFLLDTFSLAHPPMLLFLSTASSWRIQWKTDQGTTTTKSLGRKLQCQSITVNKILVRYAAFHDTYCVKRWWKGLEALNETYETPWLPSIFAPPTDSHKLHPLTSVPVGCYTKYPYDSGMKSQGSRQHLHKNHDSVWES